MNFITSFSKVETTLHSWDKCYLVIMYCPLYALLVLVSFSCKGFDWFWCQINAGLPDELGSIFSFSLFWRYFFFIQKDFSLFDFQSKRLHSFSSLNDGRFQMKLCSFFFFSVLCLSFSLHSLYFAVSSRLLIFLLQCLICTHFHSVCFSYLI